MLETLLAPPTRRERSGALATPRPKEDERFFWVVGGLVAVTAVLSVVSVAGLVLFLVTFR